MVCALGAPKRHPESRIYLFRKRVPERLKKSVGKSEIKFSLRTRDPVVARIGNLEEAARLERAWSGIDGTVVDAQGGRIMDFECKSAVGTPVGAASEAAYGHAEAPLAPSTVKRWSPVVDRLIGHLGGRLQGRDPARTGIGAERGDRGVGQKHDRNLRSVIDGLAQDPT
jgi:hypothetical protein